MEGLVLVLRQRPGHVGRGSYSGRCGSTATAADSDQIRGIDSQEPICSPAGLHCPETVR